MRYHFEKPEGYYPSVFGKTYECDHIIYSKCTLFKIGRKGLAVIQQRYDPGNKRTWWSEIDPWLTDPIYKNPKFKEFFDKYADEPEGDIYPTVILRQIMWKLRMKPIKKEIWETTFDHVPI